MPPLSVRYRAVQLLVPICGTKQSKTKPNGKLRVRFRLVALVLLSISGPVTVTVPVPVPVPPSPDALGQVKSSLQMKWPNWLQFARHRLAGLSASVAGSVPFLAVLLSERRKTLRG